MKTIKNSILAMLVILSLYLIVTIIQKEKEIKSYENFVDTLKIILFPPTKVDTIPMTLKEIFERSDLFYTFFDNETINWISPAILNPADSFIKWFVGTDTLNLIGLK
jgi:hypothetical protein